MYVHNVVKVIDPVLDAVDIFAVDWWGVLVVNIFDRSENTLEKSSVF